MSQYIFIGDKITLPLLRDYIITHKVNQGDFVLLNPQDFLEVIHEIRSTSDSVPDIPVKMLGVLINQDTTDSVPVGKVQIVNAERPF